MNRELSKEAQEAYDRIMSRGTVGTRTYNTPVGQEKIENEEVEKKKSALKYKIAAVVISATMIGAALPPALTSAANLIIKGTHEAQITLQHNRAVDGDSLELYNAVVRHNMFRAGDDQHVEYLYEQIENELHSYGDGNYDKNIYLAFIESTRFGDKYGVDPYDVSSILDHNSEYSESNNGESISFRNYLMKNGYYEDGANILDDTAYKNAINKYKDSWKHHYEDAEDKKIVEVSADTASQETPEIREMFAEKENDNTKASTLGGK